MSGWFAVFCGHGIFARNAIQTEHTMDWWRSAHGTAELVRKGQKLYLKINNKKIAIKLLKNFDGIFADIKTEIFLI